MIKNSVVRLGTFSKKIILDTSVILYDAMAIHTFHQADIYIPFSVLEEIDTFKRDMGEKGRNARQFNCSMDLLRAKGSLTQGVSLSSDTCLFVSMDVPSPSPYLDLSKVDHRVLATALFLQAATKERVQKSKGAAVSTVGTQDAALGTQDAVGAPQVELITKDINLRIKADVFGITAKDYDLAPTLDFEDLYTGIRNWKITQEQKQEFHEQEMLHVAEASFQKIGPMYPNQYVVMQWESEKLLARYSHSQRRPGNGVGGAAGAGSVDVGGAGGASGVVVPIYQPSEPVWGVYPRNIAQSCALDALMNDDIKCVSLVGKAGTGKTLLALAVGLYKTLNENMFKKLLVSRPVFPMGRDIGYLPGDIAQKLNPWMQPIFDSLDFLMGLGKKGSHFAQDLMKQGLVNIEPLAYIRGRSIPNQYLIVDEAQNLTPHEIKTVLTRVGQGTKVVLTGDCYQIDNPYVDASNNGLVLSVEKFKRESLFAHVTLNKGERSDLAELAANIL